MKPDRNHPFEVSEALLFLDDVRNGAGVDVDWIISTIGRWRPAQHPGMRILWNGLFDMAEEATTASVRISAGGHPVVVDTRGIVVDTHQPTSDLLMLETADEFGVWFKKLVYKTRRSIPYGISNLSRVHIISGICVMCSRMLTLGPGVACVLSPFRYGPLVFRFDQGSREQLREYWTSNSMPNQSPEFRMMMARVSGVCVRCPVRCEECKNPVSEVFNPQEIRSITLTKECLSCQALVLTNRPPPKLARRQLVQFSKFRKGGFIHSV